MSQRHQKRRASTRFPAILAQAARAAAALGLYVLALPADTRSGAERWAFYSVDDGREVLAYFPQRLPQGFLWTCGRERGYCRHWRQALAEAGRRRTPPRAGEFGHVPIRQSDQRNSRR